MITMPKKFTSCVRKVKAEMKKSGYKGNAYAICKASTGFYGPAKHKKRKKKASKDFYEFKGFKKRASQGL